MQIKIQAGRDFHSQGAQLEYQFMAWLTLNTNRTRYWIAIITVEMISKSMLTAHSGQPVVVWHRRENRGSVRRKQQCISEIAVETRVSDSECNALGQCQRK